MPSSSLADTDTLAPCPTTSCNEDGEALTLPGKSAESM